MGKKIENKPKIFNVNWFRTDDEGNFIWPGFGDNMRVLMWILARCEGKVDANITPIGYVPKAEDICIEGLEDVTLDTIKELLTVDKASWLEDVANQEEYFAQFGDRLPAEIKAQLEDLNNKLSETRQYLSEIAEDAIAKLNEYKAFQKFPSVFKHKRLHITAFFQNRIQKQNHI